MVLLPCVNHFDCIPDVEGGEFSVDSILTGVVLDLSSFVEDADLLDDEVLLGRLVLDEVDGGKYSLDDLRYDYI